MVKTVNDKGLEQAIAETKGHLVVGFFWTANIACEHFAPEFAKLAQLMRRRVTFLRIDAEENPAVCEALGVDSVPSTLVFKAGEKLKRFEGPYSHESLMERLKDLMAHKGGAA